MEKEREFISKIQFSSTRTLLTGFFLFPQIKNTFLFYLFLPIAEADKNYNKKVAK
jgi:hypothetical protein